MFKNKYKLNIIQLEESIERMVLYRLSDNMRWANNLGSEKFVIGFIIKDYIYNL